MKQKASSTQCQPGIAALQAVSLDRLPVAFGTKITSKHLSVTQLSFAELCTRFSKPEANRGRLTAAEYHKLDKTKKNEKDRRFSEKDGEYFCTARFKPAGVRTDADVEAVWGVALDFDSGNTTETVIRERLAGMTYLAYTSYSHRPGHERWRVLVVLSHEIDRRHLPTVFAHFQDLFDLDLDPRGGVPSQGWYTPACPYDAVGDFKSFYETGELFDPQQVLGASLAVNTVTVTAEAKSTKTNSATESSVTRQLVRLPPAATHEMLRRLKDALAHVDSDDRQMWIEVGLAVKHDLGEQGRQIWLDWSARSPKFDEVEANQTWDGFKDRNGTEPAVTLGTVFYHAHAAGWRDVPPYIKDMNDTFFVARNGSKYVIFEEEIDLSSGMVVATPLNKESFSLLMANRKFVQLAPNGDSKEIAVGPAWLKHPNRREYRGVVFDPNRSDPQYYNLWRGFAIKPVKGNWRKLRWHILFVICSGTRMYYRYVLGWLAYCVQFPGTRPEVALVLRGGRGAGKGMLLRTFGSLFGPHFVQITQPSHLTGNFNAHLQNALFVFADEAFYAGDKAAEATLKGLITEPTLVVERKGFDAVMQPNFIKLAMASNSEWVVPAGADERRYFVLDVSDEKKQDNKYFAELNAEIAAGAAAAMLYDLLALDLSRFNVRKPPQSDALKEQKLLSMSPIDRWWLDKLTSGSFTDIAGFYPEDCEWGLVSTSVVHADYLRATKNYGVSHRSAGTQLGMHLRKLLPKGSLETVKKRMPHGKRGNCYQLPPLDICREHFEQLMGMEGYEWPRETLEVVRVVARAKATASFTVRRGGSAVELSA